MKTAEKRARLSSIKVIVANPVYSEDMGIQYDVMTGVGVYKEMGSVGQWPYVRFRVSDDLRSLQKSIMDGVVFTEEELLENEIIKELCTYHSFLYGSFLLEGEELTEAIQEICKGLKNVDLSGADLFAFVSAEEWDMSFRFFDSYEQLIDAVEKNWANSVKPYNKMDDNEIDYWYDVAEKNGWHGIPHASFGC